MKIAVYRVRQFFMSIMMRMMSFIKPRLISSPGAIMAVKDVLNKEGVDNVLIVTTNGFIKRRTLEPLFDSLKQAGVLFTVYSDVTPDPTIDCVEKGLESFVASGCKGIVAVGGGSVLDTAKVIGARASCPKRRVQKMKGTLKVRRKIPLLIAVPTTAGTGSETTAAAVVTDVVEGVHYKYAVNDYVLIPKYAVLDPKLTVALPGKITATTGMDALTHAIEAYTNKFASGLVKENAKKAICLIFENILKAYENGEDIEARENMLLASFYAGVAFNNNFVGYVHAVSHAVGAMYGISHGEANAIILPKVLRNFGESAYASLSEIAKWLGMDGQSDKERADKLISSIEELNDKLGIPKNIEPLKNEDFKEIINRAITEANPLYPVPGIWGEKEFNELLLMLWEE